MVIQKMQNKDMDLILSTEAKPRLKWTAELHRRFVEAVVQLGGAEKATPKSLLRVMCIPGLTLYHLKSHLQKYRLGKNQPSETFTDNQQEEVDYSELEIRDDINDEITGRPEPQIDESLKIAQALQVQLEVQKKLHEQIEVQRHLQLRIEAQGKYLHSILMKAQDTIAMRAQVSESVSTRNQNSSVSELTDTDCLSLMNVGKRSVRGTDCSMDSSLTSSESSGKKDEKFKVVEAGEESDECNRESSLLLSMEIGQYGNSVANTVTSGYGNAGKKRSRSSISDETCVEQPMSKRSTALEMKHDGQLKKLKLFKEFDLNSKYQSEMDSGLQELNLQL